MLQLQRFVLFFLMFCGLGHAGVVVAARVAFVWAGAADVIPMRAGKQSNH